MKTTNTKMSFHDGSVVVAAPVPVSVKNLFWILLVMIIGCSDICNNTVQAADDHSSSFSYNDNKKHTKNDIPQLDYVGKKNNNNENDKKEESFHLNSPSLTLTLTYSNENKDKDNDTEENNLFLSSMFQDWMKRYGKSYSHDKQPHEQQVEEGVDETNDSSHSSFQYLRSSFAHANDVSNSATTTATHKKKNGLSSLSEYEERFEIFCQNYHWVQQHNQAYEKGYTSYALTMDGPFSDLTHDEFASLYLMESQNCSATTTTTTTTAATAAAKKLWNDKKSSFQDLPKSIDWRTKGVITPVKNQQHCGSCWTFSTTGCLEAHTCIQDKAKTKTSTFDTDETLSLSSLDCPSWTGFAEQQLVDCAGDYNNHGCNGGLPSQAFEYIKYTGGIDLEPTYPYIANETGSCYASLGTIGGRVAEVFNITSQDEDDLAYAIANIGPVSIAYQVSPDFRLYSHGVYDSYNVTTNSTMCNNTAMDVNHAVVAVGLGVTEDHPSKDNSTKPEQPFYIVRNSWGTSWGMEGYFWMLRGKNLCGVSDCASFPLVPSIETKAAAATATTTTSSSMSEETKNMESLLQNALDAASVILQLKE